MMCHNCEGNTFIIKKGESTGPTEDSDWSETEDSQTVVPKSGSQTGSVKQSRRRGKGAVRGDTMTGT